jgi:uroporphyrin-III C-methyltransferase/precorrin-2 dehydrogenase/sirohydrochlorin ferrochelatase/uroporphyrin-III C-methyltransferase
MIQFHKIGKVILAGAGPGDPELISLKALNFIKTADVILTDRLVSPVLLDEYAKPSAEIIYVGKQCSKGIWTPQQNINELLVQYAKKGHLVLRLKGGDANLFSNVLDELQILKENSIPYEIIPGISAIFGASAYSGIPLTARGYSRGLRLLTLHDLNTVSDLQWQDWATTDDTLAFYMSGLKLSSLIDKLKNLGIEKSKGLAVIEQATTTEQKTKIFGFDTIDANETKEFNHVPTLIIIGKVVNLHQNFAWFSEKKDTFSYFDQHKSIINHAIAN